MAHQKLGLIRWTTLVGTGVVGAALGALALKVATALGQRVTAPGWAVPAGLALGGVAALAGAWFAHQRFHVLHRYPQP
ncbi:MAG: hypothetical protein LBS56_03910, partial [Propionibacteriaceae bacterium]|nr:hypothetical protein [Propionibacteriaceae bacterium]